MYLNSGQTVDRKVGFGWTLTWDVFKLEITSIFENLQKGWTLTWDVFK